MEKAKRVRLLFDDGARLLQASMDNDLEGIEKYSSPKTVNACVGDLDGSFPLHWAVFHKNRQAIARLVADGADPFAKDDNDMDSFDMADGDQSLVEYIVGCMQQREQCAEKNPPAPPAYEPC